MSIILLYNIRNYIFMLTSLLYNSGNSIFMLVNLLYNSDACVRVDVDVGADAGVVDVRDGDAGDLDGQTEGASSN